MDDSALDNDILGMNVLPFLLGHFGKHLVTNGGIINIRFGRLIRFRRRQSAHEIRSADDANDPVIPNYRNALDSSCL